VHEIACEDDTVPVGYALFGKLMELSPRPTAVFTGGDDVAVGVLAAARDNGVRVPEDLAVLGFDDQPIAEVFSITTIRQPVRKMGRRAMELLMTMIATGNSDSVRKITRVKYRLVVRKTA
jgi:LacI family transcriptional regulator